MYVLTLPVLRKMLHTAAVDLKDNVQYLCELDGVAGDGDHGIAIGHIADILRTHADDITVATMNLLLEGIGDACMAVNAGSSGPLWGTIFAGMADGIDDQQELTDIEFKRMFAQAKEDFMDVSKAKEGDRKAALKRFWQRLPKQHKKAPMLPQIWWQNSDALKT